MKRLTSPARHRAFTLIELLCVIAIIALLATLVMPATGTFLEKSRQLACAQNLRQIYVFTSSAATDNENRFPKIEIDRDTPAYGEGEAKSLLDTLKPYGCTEKTLQCPTDLGSSNWFSKKGTSYMWQPYSEEEPTTAITIYTPRGAFPAKLSRVRLCQDWDVVHAPEDVGMRRRMNVLYADGHVSLR